MDNYSNIEKMADSELLVWLERQQLLGLNHELARRFSRLFRAYHRLANEMRRHGLDTP